MASSLQTLTDSNLTETFDTEANTDGLLTLAGEFGGAVVLLEYAQAGATSTYYPLNLVPHFPDPLNAPVQIPLTFPGAKLKVTAKYPTASTSIKAEVTTP